MFGKMGGMMGMPAAWVAAARRRSIRRRWSDLAKSGRASAAACPAAACPDLPGLGGLRGLPGMGGASAACPASRRRNDHRSTNSRQRKLTMSLKIRLARAGAKKRPFYRIVVADSARPRDGRFIEIVGTYNPMLPKGDAKRVVARTSSASSIGSSVGAQPTDRVLRFLDAAGLAKRDAAQQPGEGQARQEGAGARRCRRCRPPQPPRRRRRRAAPTAWSAASGCAAVRRKDRVLVAPHRRGARHRGEVRVKTLHRRSRWRSRAYGPLDGGRRADASRSTRARPAAGTRRTCWSCASRASPTATRPRR